jgi:hypothetical protein
MPATKPAKSCLRFIPDLQKAPVRGTEALGVQLPDGSIVVIIIVVAVVVVIVAVVIFAVVIFAVVIPVVIPIIIAVIVAIVVPVIIAIVVPVIVAIVIVVTIIIIIASATRVIIATTITPPIATDIIVVVTQIIRARDVDEVTGAVADLDTRAGVVVPTDAFDLLLENIARGAVIDHFELLRATDRLDLDLAKTIVDLDTLKPLGGQIADDLVGG